MRLYVLSSLGLRVLRVATKGPVKTFEKVGRMGGRRSAQDYYVELFWMRGPPLPDTGDTTRHDLWGLRAHPVSEPKSPKLATVRA